MKRLTLALIGLTVAALLAFLAVAGIAYDRGNEAGMRDLCGEIGGTWNDTSHGYCDTGNEG